MKFRLLFSIAALLVLAACAGTPTTTPTPDPEPEPEPPAPTYQITAKGFATGYDSFWIRVKTKGEGSAASWTDVDDALVTINGITATWNPGPSYYEADLGLPLAPGDPISVQVEVDGEIMTAATTAPAVAVVTSPAAGGHLDSAGPLTIEWTIAEDPTEYAFIIFHPTVGNTWNYEADGTMRQFDLVIPERMPLDGGPFRFRVVAQNIGEFTGAADSSSTLEAESRSDFHPVTIGP